MAKTDESIWFDFIDQDKYDKNSELWLAALESDEYVQGNGSLHYVPSLDPDYADQPDEFCCLGLGCKVARFKPNGNDGTLVQYGKTTETTMPPVEFARWLGFKIPTKAERIVAYTAAYGYKPERDDCSLEETAVSVVLNNERRLKKGYQNEKGSWVSIGPFESLAAMNDSGASFKEIARLVRKYGVRVQWEG